MRVIKCNIFMYIKFIFAIIAISGDISIIYSTIFNSYFDLICEFLI